MKFITFKFIIYSLIVILFLHYIINHLLKNEKKYKNNKKNIVEKLSSEKENNSKLKKKINEESNIKNEESNIKNEESEKNNEMDMNNMKNDILSFLENNQDLYQTSKDREQNINDLALDENMNQDLKITRNYENSYFKGINTEPLDKFFDTNTESIINYNEKKKNNKVIEPQIDLQTKEKIYIDNNTFDQSNCIKPDNWKYHDENIMNGGEMEGGLTAWDNLDSGLAMYPK